DGPGQAQASGRPEEGGVAEGEYAAVRGHQPVAAAGGGGSQGHHGLVEVDGAGGAAEGGVAEGEHAAVRGHQVVPRPEADGAKPTMGWLSLTLPVDPKKEASPKEKMPPSEATSQ